MKTYRLTIGKLEPDYQGQKTGLIIFFLSTDRTVSMSTEEPDPIDPGKAGDGLRREMATHAARDAGIELDHLKKLLSAQDAAKVHAQSVAAQLQKELRTLEPDNARLRAEVKRLQDQLAFAEQEGS